MIHQSLFKKSKKTYVPLKPKSQGVPDDLVMKCDSCGSLVFTDEVNENLKSCPKCGHLFRMGAWERIRLITDAATFEEWDKEMDFKNPLETEGYEDRFRAMQQATGLKEAVVTGKAMIGGYETALAVCDSHFMMASMGSIVGEKITRMVERASEEKLPVIIFTASGGARMQEGMVSLMQMAKTSAALKRHSDQGGLYITVLTDPTTGGVTASFAMLGDIILAEPDALVGFAGRRVIEQTIGQKLPEDFQRAEFLLDHGFVDAVIERKQMKKALRRLLAFYHNPVREESLGEMPACHTEKVKTVEKDLTAWERVQISRSNERPVGTDYIKGLFTHFSELHGDRYYKDDRSVIGGIGRFRGRAVTVIAQAKGHSTKENVRRNFGMPSPEGYRKALRLMKQAEKFGRPIICFVDTPGAFCGIEAEERGQGEAIARNLYEMSSLKVPVLTIVIGEGGSGGALAMAVANEVWMLENSVYSILSPEGYASILWKDGKRAEEAAGVMKMTAADLLDLGMVEKVFPEPENYTVPEMMPVLDVLEREIQHFLLKTETMTGEQLAMQKYERFRHF